MMSRTDKGFLLLPLLVFLMLSGLLLLLATDDLSRSYFSHQAQMHLGCRQLVEQLSLGDVADCPPCPGPGVCGED